MTSGSLPYLLTETMLGMSLNVFSLVLMLGGYRCVLSASLFVGSGKSVSAFTIHRSVLIFESSENKICSSVGRGPADILSG